MDEAGCELISSLENEVREEARARKESDKKVREAIKTLERELRDEAVSRKTAERKIVQLYEHFDTLAARLAFLEGRLEEFDSCEDPTNCIHHNRKHGGGNGDGEGKLDTTTPQQQVPNAPPSPLIPNLVHSPSVPSTQTPGSPPHSPLHSLRVSVSTSQIHTPTFSPSSGIGSPRYRLSANMVPFNGVYSPPGAPTSPPTTPSFIAPSPPSYSPNSPKTPVSSFPPPGNNAAAMRALSASNLSMYLEKADANGKSTPVKQNGKEKDKKDKDKDKDKDKEKEKDKDKNKDKVDDDEITDGRETTKRKIFSRKGIVSMLSPPTSPSVDQSPKTSRKDSDKDKEKEKDKDKEEGGDRMEKSRSFQLVRSTSQALRLKSRSFPLKGSTKLDQMGSGAVFGNMEVTDDICVKVIKEITSFLKNYVHLAPTDLFQEKVWSEQAILLKEALRAGSLPDLSFKYQHDPYSVAQFLYEILASSEKGILAKVGNGLVDSVEIDLSAYPGLKHYKLSLLHSLVFLLDEDPHFALFYTLDLLRAFYKIRPEASLPFFGSKFGPICLKEFPEKAPNAFSTLLANFSAILEAKEDINFVVKDGKQTVHAASLERLFEKLLDPYYRDPVFVDTFFLTYDYFISPEDMLNKFTDFYWLAASGYPQNWKTQLSIRVLAVIKMWIMTHESYFQKDETFLYLLRTFVDSVTSPFPNELAFFRYFSTLAYRGVSDLDAEPISEEFAESVDLSTDSEFSASKMSSSISDMANSVRDDRSSSALTLYDDDDEDGLRSDSFLRSGSDFSSFGSPTLPPHIATERRGSLSRSNSSSNIFLTKDNKVGTAPNPKALKPNSSTNIFASPRSSSRPPSPTPSSDSPRSLPIEDTPPKGTPLTINFNTNPSPTNGEPLKKNSGLLQSHRRSRGRGNSDDGTLIKSMAMSPSLPFESKIGNYSPVGMVDPTVVAMHMAVIDQSLLRLIPYTEWLHKAFVTQEMSPNFHCMVAKFNDWGRWACTEILRREKLADRVTVVTYFVDIIKHSVSINNFNAAAALIGGLSHSSISRLRPTWEKVPAKVMQDFTRITTLFEMSKNYKNYREAVKACKPPVIPYLALIPKDLIAIEEGNATVLENGLINFHKLRLLAKLVKYVSQIQQPLYVHPGGVQDPQLNEYLRNRLGGKEGLLVEREMMNASMLLQPFAKNM